jgi:tetratricopeptide (TPR) repeat protein
MRWVVMLLVVAPALSGVARAEPSTTSRAEALLQRLYTERDTYTRFRIADEAQALCEKAMAERPKDVQPHVLMARALTVADLFHPEACRPGMCERAVDELKKARLLDVSGVDAERIASELGIVLSRLGRFAEALVEYDLALRLVEADRRPNSLDEDGDKAVLYGNSAETLMALGRLDQAIERYRLAEAASSAGSTEWQLAQWGLAVALDRDEQVEKSRAALARVLELDKPMGRLSEDGVFFEPAGDKRYYEALGHEAMGDRAQTISRPSPTRAGRGARARTSTRSRRARRFRPTPPSRSPWACRREWGCARRTS